MRKIVIIVVLGAAVTWGVIHANDLQRTVDSVFTYASDNPGTFWTGVGVLAAILAVSIFGSRR